MADDFLVCLYIYIYLFLYPILDRIYYKLMAIKILILHREIKVPCITLCVCVRARAFLCRVLSL